VTVLAAGNSCQPVGSLALHRHQYPWPRCLSVKQRGWRSDFKDAAVARQTNLTRS
jgi:hypothetical protein